MRGKTELFARSSELVISHMAGKGQTEQGHTKGALGAGLDAKNFAK
jgi:hypothetical protein